MNSELPDKLVKILLVEDSPDDIELTVEGFKEGNLQHDLSVVEDGIEALDFLRRQGKYMNAPEPDVILLDLNLPRKDGREVLDDIRADRNLKHIPVIVLTASTAERDILQGYLRANSYIVKPVDMDQFVSALQDLKIGAVARNS